MQKQTSLTMTPSQPETVDNSPSKMTRTTPDNPPPQISSSTPSANAPTCATVAQPTTSHDVDAPPEDDMLLVSEFPPPPYYYGLASKNMLTPPEIPYRAFRVAAKKVTLERQRAKEESERIRLVAEGCGSASKNSASKTMEVLGGDSSTLRRKSDIVGEASGEGFGSQSEHQARMESSGQTAIRECEGGDVDSIDPNDLNEPLVAIFGEIVEDPTLMVEEECEDPNEIRENVKELNQNVVRGFLKLVRMLVNDPGDNKKIRDELSHNIFLMLQECNKFREHQAREILISTLEQQLERRREGLALLKKEITAAEENLESLKQFRGRA
mmetsp:Transcript_11422/g.22930  ORF Transcript_11422/g.22930 Transcript_11422/m.22930 type:complete len:326 (+) Transcript_11422:50-1027(+)